jgi:hypothetical protein
MVESPNGRDMLNENELETRQGRVEGKLDALTELCDRRFADIDARFVDIDARFVGIDAAFIEQRQYTEFAFDRLRQDMKAGFSQIDTRFNQLERKLNQFIDTQSKTNELVERRLQLRESGNP